MHRTRRISPSQQQGAACGDLLDSRGGWPLLERLQIAGTRQRIGCGHHGDYVVQGLHRRPAPAGADDGQSPHLRPAPARLPPRSRRAQLVQFGVPLGGCRLVASADILIFAARRVEYSDMTSAINALGENTHLFQHDEVVAVAAYLVGRMSCRVPARFCSTFMQLFQIQQDLPTARGCGAAGASSATRCVDSRPARARSATRGRSPRTAGRAPSEQQISVPSRVITWSSDTRRSALEYAQAQLQVALYRRCGTTPHRRRRHRSVDDAWE